MAILLVAAGGALGSAARFLVSEWAARAAPTLPLGTFLVNVTGCVLVGAVVGLLTGRPAAATAAWRLFLVVGVCGGFTTFSAFGYETFELIRGDQAGLAIANAATQVSLGLGGVWLGLALSRAAQGALGS